MLEICIEQSSTQLNQGHQTLAQAISYAERGWAVLPLHTLVDGRCTCKDEKCSSPGKHPRARRGVNDATLDPSLIRNWFEKWPESNIGIATGKISNLLIIDVDDDREVKGSDTLEQLLTQNEDAITTRIVRTGSGRHIYFKQPQVSIPNSVRLIGPGLDVRSDGGYVVAPPSRHVNGAAYYIEQDAEIEELPDWLLERLESRSRYDTPPGDWEGEPDGVEMFPKGSRNDKLFRLGCRLRGVEGKIRDDLELLLLSYNAERCKPPLDEDEVLNIVDSVCKYPLEKAAPRSLLRQGQNPLWWFRFDVRSFFSDPNVNAMYDFQMGWYIKLLSHAWNDGGFLTADHEVLWRLAKAKSRKLFDKDSPLVLNAFELFKRHDGRELYKHRYMAAEYNDTLEKWMTKVNAGGTRLAKPEPFAAGAPEQAELA